MPDGLVAAHLQCLRQNWPEPLEALALPLLETHAVPPDLAGRILETQSGFGLLPMLEPLLPSSDGLFLKMAGFSFRGTQGYAATGGLAEDIGDLRMLLARLPGRMRWAVAAMLEAKEEIVLEVAPHVSIPLWQEFRLFFHQRNLIGVSQYALGQVFPEISTNQDVIIDELGVFMETLMPALHLADVVVDVVATPGQNVQVIELNPFHRRTDPCAFTWDAGGDFDGSFRFQQ